MATQPDIPETADLPAISIRGLSKCYTVRSASEMRWVNLVLPRYAARDNRIDHWVLRDVSFDVPRGCKLALVGDNGSGKSTLLKLIANLIGPSSGRIRVNGSVLPLLELGAGFHPDLTGYENVFLQAAILGLPREEIRKRLGRIVEFAGLDDFMETPVKYYSSGMFARLGFSVAVHCDPDILLVDEILAVGDQDFQDKSFHKLMEFVGEGRTLILVSHNLFGLREICDEAIWLDQGRIRETGPARTVVESYMLWNRERTEQFEPGRGTTADRPGSHPDTLPGCRIDAVRFCDHDGHPREQLLSGTPVAVEIECAAEAEIPDVHCRVLFFSGKRDAALEMSSAFDGKPLALPAGKSTIRVAVDSLVAMPRKYTVEVSLLRRPENADDLPLATAQTALTVAGEVSEKPEQHFRTRWDFDLKSPESGA